MASKKKTAPAPTTESVDPETGEVTEKAKPNLPARVRAEDGTITLPGGRVIKIKRTLTRLLLRMGDNQSVAVKFTDKIYTGKEIKGSKMAPAEMATVENLSDGHEYDFIVNTVLKGILEEKCPNHGYVGKSFLIHRGEKAPGKRYVTFEVAEVA